MKIHISPLLFVMAFVLTLFGFGYEFLTYAITIIMHEMAHAEVSKRLGYHLNEIRLMPYGASLTGSFEGARWKDEALIAVAGPICNLVLAVLCIAVWWLIPSSYFFTEIFVGANIYTAVFNLIPIFPLDGGRALLAILTSKFPRHKVYRIMRIFGFVLSAIFVGLFVISFFVGFNFSFALISVFILISTVFPDKNSKYQRLYSMAYRMEKLKKGLPVKEIMVSGDMSLLQLVKISNGNYFYRFVVVDNDFNPLGTLNETSLENLSIKFGLETKASEIVKKN